jgi:hypothetical protein
VFQSLGLPPSKLPVRWIESGAAGSDPREYFEDILEYRSSVPGGELDIAVRAHLVVTQKAETTSGTYELTEFHIKSGRNGAADTVTTVASKGVATIETVKGTKGLPLRVYRFDGGSSPDKARVLVRFGDELVVAPENVAEAEADSGYSLARLGSATAERVEVTDSVMDLLNHKVRVRVGQELVARLDRDGGKRTWTLVNQTEIDEFQLLSSTQEGDAQVFRLKAVRPGWLDLRFEYNKLPNTFRVRVE